MSQLKSLYHSTAHECTCCRSCYTNSTIQYTNKNVAAERSPRSASTSNVEKIEDAENVFRLLSVGVPRSMEENAPQKKDWAGGRVAGAGPEKTQPQMRDKTRDRRFARPLRGAEVLVAVRGPSPGEGGGKNK